jgi:nucleotide-binding universal stress UspA family protein
MKALGRIVALTDFSPAAAAACTRAARLAQAHGAPLTLLHALAPPGADLAMAGAAALGMHMPAMTRAVGEALAREQRALADAVGVEAECQMLEGAVHRALPAFLEDSASELVVLGAHGEGHPRASLLGSTADRLLRVLDRPLLLVRREPTDQGYRRVALATDFSEGSERAALFGMRLVPDAEHVLLHADERLYESTLAFAGASDEVMDEYRRSSAVEGMRNLEAFAARLRQHGGAAAVPALREGRPWRALAGLVDEAGIELAVVGRQGRSRIESLLLGSTSHYAATALACDALVVP